MPKKSPQPYTTISLLEDLNPDVFHSLKWWDRYLVHDPKPTGKKQRPWITITTKLAYSGKEVHGLAVEMGLAHATQKQSYFTARLIRKWLADRECKTARNFIKYGGQHNLTEHDQHHAKIVTPAPNGKLIVALGGESELATVPLEETAPPDHPYTPYHTPEADADLADGVHKALADLTEAVGKAEAAGLTVHVYVPDGEGHEVMPGANIEISRRYTGRA